MTTVVIPEKLNGSTFYTQVLPFIYRSILKKEYKIDLDMSSTVLANPEGLINILSCPGNL